MASMIRHAVGSVANVADDLAKFGRTADGVTPGTMNALQSAVRGTPTSGVTSGVTDLAKQPSSSWFANNPRLTSGASLAVGATTTAAPLIIDTAAKAAKNTGEAADEAADAAAQAGKNTDGAAQAAKNTDGAAQAGKNADEATQAGKNTDGAAQADEIASIVKKADEDAVLAVKEAGKQTPTQILTKKNLVTATGLALSITAAAVATDTYFKLNNKKYNVISIDDKSTSSNILTQITIQAGDKFTTNDKVKLENTNCIPSIQGEFNIEKVISQDVFIIKTPYKVTTKGTNGTLTLYTTFESQLAQALKDTTGAIGSTVGGGLASGVKNTVDSFFIGLGISPENMWIIYIIIFVILCFFLAKNIGII
jgi:hypothetical protein